MLFGGKKKPKQNQPVKIDSQKKQTVGKNITREQKIEALVSAINNKRAEFGKLKQETGRDIIQELAEYTSYLMKSDPTPSKIIRPRPKDNHLKNKK